MIKYIGYLLVFLGIAGVIFVFYFNSKYSSLTRTFSSRTLLTSSWEKYKDQFIGQDGRVIDPVGSITTSEGQSYAMLRAVWIDDKDAFDTVWKWTKDNLKRKEDRLFGWRWGQRSDGSHGFLPGGGENSASDADVDIALALILASRRWNNRAYQNEAKLLLKDIWDKEVVVIPTGTYLVAGNWAKAVDKFVINTSYLAPYSFRIFASVDQDHDWLSLVKPSYDLLEKSGWAKLNKNQGVGLPPDWLEVASPSGQLAPPSINNLTTDYSYDALRVPWRVALDWHFNKDEQARKYLQSNFNVLVDSFRKESKLIDRYSHDGRKLSSNENPAMYATSLSFVSLIDQDLAKKMYEQKILRLYSNDQNQFNPELSYFDQNWLWFGVALFTNQLSDFSK